MMLLIGMLYCSRSVVEEVSYLSLAASPCLPGQSQMHTAKRCAVGKGLANFALNCVSLECQVHVTCDQWSAS